MDHGNGIRYQNLCYTALCTNVFVFLFIHLIWLIRWLCDTDFPLWFLNCLSCAFSVSSWAYPSTAEGENQRQWESGCYCSCLLCCNLGVSNRWGIGAGWKCKQGFKGETYHPKTFAASNSRWWRTWHSDQRNNSGRGCYTTHSQITHQQIF